MQSLQLGLGVGMLLCCMAVGVLQGLQWMYPVAANDRNSTYVRAVASMTRAMLQFVLVLMV